MTPAAKNDDDKKRYKKGPAGDGTWIGKKRAYPQFQPLRLADNIRDRLARAVGEFIVQRKFRRRPDGGERIAQAVRNCGCELADHSVFFTFDNPALLLGNAPSRDQDHTSECEKKHCCANCRSQPDDMAHGADFIKNRRG